MRVALVGTGGYGAVHLDNIERLAGAGRLSFAGCTDVAAPGPELSVRIARLGGTFFSEYETLLRRARPDVVVVAAPPHLHRALACAALDAGASVLVEKPPAVALADLDAMVAATRAGGLCQVGFQCLGSGALSRLHELMDDGSLGDIEDIVSAGCWVRGDSYYGRAPWAGRRRLGGAAVNDGALSNPFAHGVMNCLDLAGMTDIAGTRVDAELYRTRAMEVEDTGCVRLTAPGRPPVTIAVTLCASNSLPTYVEVVGSRGSARWWYGTDRIEVRRQGRSAVTEEHPRTDLLDNLIDALSGGQTPLLCPVEHTRAFVGLVETLARQPVRPLPPVAFERRDDEHGPRYVIAEIEAVVDRAVRERRLFSQLDPRPAWAQAPAAA